MGKKYLDTKQNTIEASVLDVWAKSSEEQEAIRNAAEMFVKEKYDQAAIDAKTDAEMRAKGYTYRRGAARVYGGSKRDPRVPPGATPIIPVNRSGMPKRSKVGKVLGALGRLSREEFEIFIDELMLQENGKIHVFRVTSGGKQGNVHAKSEKEAIELAKKKGMRGKIKVTDMGEYKGQPGMVGSDYHKKFMSGQLEEVELDEWHAANGKERRVHKGDKRMHEVTGDKEEYTKFFNSAMKKFGVTSPDQLKGKKEKEFYDYVDANWKGDNEKAEQVVRDFKVNSMREALRQMWAQQNEEGSKDEVLTKPRKKTKTDTGGKPVVINLKPKTGNPHY